MRHKPTEEDFTEVRVAVIGNVDAGKVERLNDS